jgi:hypothetical protein
MTPDKLIEAIEGEGDFGQVLGAGSALIVVSVKIIGIEHLRDDATKIIGRKVRRLYDCTEPMFSSLRRSAAHIGRVVPSCLKGRPHRAKNLVM